MRASLRLLTRLQFFVRLREGLDLELDLVLG